MAKITQAVLATINSLYEKIQQLAKQLGFQVEELPLHEQEPQQPKESEKVELTYPNRPNFFNQ